MNGIVTFTPNPALDVSTAVAAMTPDHKLRCTAARYDPGGGGINVARVVRRLGSEVTAIYPRGGITGHTLDSLVERERITCKTTDIAEETRLDFAVHEDASGKQFRFVLPGPTLGAHECRACLDTLAACAGPGFVVASGSLPPGAPPDLYARASRIVKSAEGRFLLDTSGPALKAALAEGVFLIKPSLRELCDAAGESLEGEADWIHACTGLVKQGRAAMVALTLGPGGALLVAEGRVLRATPPPLAPVSSVGAGDSFLGALVWSLAAGYELGAALRLAVAAGSSAVLNPGTELAHADDARRLVDTVTVREM
ncbi:MAG: 1-phosphofructokinase family hexose kinase [Bradyrhizobiaceae bacterium]|nr:1-phosphofructokinase family hexose kinase [Bradyrhizobiaceae bacterium]